MGDTKVIETSAGQARLHVNRGVSPVLTMVLSHGSGPGGIEAPGLGILARVLPRHRVNVIRIEHPWVLADKVAGTKKSLLDETLCRAVESFRLRTPLVVGGRGAGARSAVRVGRDLGAVGVLGLAFPLHLPRRPESHYRDELARVRLPLLLIQGDRDLHGHPDEFPEDLDMCVVEGADADFNLRARAAVQPSDVEDIVLEATLEWLVRMVVGNRLG